MLRAVTAAMTRRWWRTRTTSRIPGQDYRRADFSYLRICWRAKGLWDPLGSLGTMSSKPRNTAV